MELRFALPVVRSSQRRVLETVEFGGYTIPQGWNVFHQISEMHQDTNVHECLGKEFARLEMKLFAALLIRDYDWTLLPGQDLTRIVLPFSRPQDGLKVKFWRQQGE